MLQFLADEETTLSIGSGLTVLENQYGKLFTAGTAQIELELLTPEAMQTINQQYRTINEPTDVLSFPVYTSMQELPVDISFLLGSILICPAKAAAYEEPLLDLVHHGFLHLIGYDHETDRHGWDAMEMKLLSSLVATELHISPAPH